MSSLNRAIAIHIMNMSFSGPVDIILNSFVKKIENFIMITVKLFVFSDMYEYESSIKIYVKSMVWNCISCYVNNGVWKRRTEHEEDRRK